jgi:histidinol-phosphate aminotransferase
MNENVDGLPEAFVRRIVSEIDRELLATYPEYGSLLQKIAKHNDILPENICISSGSDGAIKYIFDAYVSSGDRVLITDPTFAMYPVYCQIFDAQSITISYHKDFSFPLDECLNAICPDIRLAVFVNPNNPTGIALERADLIEILNMCAEHDVLLVLDEAYFYHHDETLINEIKSYDNLIVLRTFSKLCALAGARIGYAAAGPEIIQNLYKVKSTFDVNAFAVHIAEKLLDEPGLIKKAIEEVNKGKRFLVNQLNENKVEFRDGKANFVLIKCPGCVQELVERLAKQGILVAGGFPQEFLTDYLRVTVGGIQSMRQFWDVFSGHWEELSRSR